MAIALNLHEWTGLAEFGSEQLEFIKLSDWTGNGTYARIVEGNVALMHQKHPDRVRHSTHPACYVTEYVSCSIDINPRAPR